MIRPTLPQTVVLMVMSFCCCFFFSLVTYVIRIPHLPYASPVTSQYAKAQEMPLNNRREKL